MAMTYPKAAIPESAIPRALAPILQHLLDTYASETNKVASIWDSFEPADLGFKIHPRSSSVGEIFKHQLLSERRFFGEFLGSPEPPPTQIVPPVATPRAFVDRLAALALPRLAYLASRGEEWWVERVPFFDVQRERIWIFWRRLLHTAHHRTQVAVALRLLGRPVPPTYGPTADRSFAGADPTISTESAGRSLPPGSPA